MSQSQLHMWLIICCSVLCLGVCLPMYRCNLRKNKVFATVFKSLGTLCAMALALIAAIRLEPRAYVCAGAILLCAISDYVLNFNFLMGVVTFMFGHFGLIAWFLIMNPAASPVISTLHVICFIGFCLISFFIIYNWRKRMNKKLLPAFCVYAAVLSAMAACAIAGGTALHIPAGILCAVGGALFYISDVMVLNTTFAERNEAFHTVLMFIYYSANLLFGASCLLMCSAPALV